MGSSRARTLYRINIMVCMRTTPGFDVRRTALETRPYTVIQATLDTLCLDTGFLQRIEYLVRHFLAAHVRILFLVIVIWETVEAAQPH